MTRWKTLSAVSAVAAAALVLASCGGGSSGKGGSSGSGTVDKSKTIILGTTDSFKALDPAYTYDLGGQTIVYNIYQNLLKVPAGETTPVPDAAQSCDFTGKATYTCTMKPGLKFSNDDPLDAAAVVYSLNRMVKIKDPNGPSSLLGAMKKVEAQGNKVVFTLNQHDNTWPFVLTTLASAIVDPKVFPEKSRLADAKVIGSGVYKITSYQPKQQLTLALNPNYGGDAEPQNSGFIVRYEQA